MCICVSMHATEFGYCCREFNEEYRDRYSDQAVLIQCRSLRFQRIKKTLIVVTYGPNRLRTDGWSIRLRTAVYTEKS